MRWTWDPDKAEKNIRKHKVSFGLASAALDDPYAASLPDPHADGDRWNTLCMIGGIVLLVVHTWPEENGGGEAVGRIISARKATNQERRAYENG